MKNKHNKTLKRLLKKKVKKLPRSFSGEFNRMKEVANKTAILFDATSKNQQQNQRFKKEQACNY